MHISRLFHCEQTPTLSVVMTNRCIFWCRAKSLKNSPVTTKVLPLILPKTNNGKAGFRGRRFVNWIQMPFLYITRSLAWCQTVKRSLFETFYLRFFIFLSTTQSCYISLDSRWITPLSIYTVAVRHVMLLFWYNGLYIYLI